MKCGSLKSVIGEANSQRGCLSRGSVSHKGTPTSILLKHSLRVLFLGNQVSSVIKTTITLIPISTKELLHKKWGSPRPPHKIVHAAPHQVGGSLTLPASLKLQGAGAPRYLVGSTKNHSTMAQSLSFLLSKELT